MFLMFVAAMAVAVAAQPPVMPHILFPKYKPTWDLGRSTMIQVLTGPGTIHCAVLCVGSIIACFWLVFLDLAMCTSSMHPVDSHSVTHSVLPCSSPGSDHHRHQSTDCPFILTPACAADVPTTWWPHRLHQAVRSRVVRLVEQRADLARRPPQRLRPEDGRPGSACQAHCTRHKSVDLPQPRTSVRRFHTLFCKQP